MIRVAINGFGRIGRMVVRAGLEHEGIEFVACNDLTDTKTLAHLFKYDSAHGTFKGSVEYEAKALIINGKRIEVFSERNPENLPWKEHNIDLVIESTGIFTNKEGMQKHIQAGAKKVLLSAPAKGEGVKTIVLGVNEHSYNKEQDTFVSNASCTTNCLAPIVKVLDDNYGVEKGYMTTIHAYTGDQRLVDAPHKDLRRARAAAQNIIPTSTGAAKAVGIVLPHLAGKLDGIAVRVPVIDASFTDFVAELKQEVSAQQIKELMKNVAEHHLKGILEYCEHQPVSGDIIGNAHSSIFDADIVFAQGKMIKIGSWYDNEWGYSNRVVQLAKYMFK